MRPPDIVIGTDYLHRWYLIPRNRFFNVYLHKFIGSDDPRSLHDHPWISLSFLLKGELYEILENGGRKIRRFWPVYRNSVFAHRLVMLDGPVWTLFITGPRIREWGFHCPRGWKHWSEFTTPDGKNINKGCDD